MTPRQQLTVAPMSDRSDPGARAIDMWHLGRQISRTTVRRILKADGIEPAPQQLKHIPWGAFLKAHWGAIAAIDFFQVEVLTRRGPVRGTHR